MVRRALITGITGQDGSYLAELLLSKGYEVHGIIRRASTFNTARIDHIFDRLILHHGDLTDAGCLRHILAKVQATDVYNLAAQSHVRVSFDQPEYTVDTNALGVLRLLEAVRDVAPKARFYQASSSEMFGASPAPQSEATPFRPRSPYACAKVCAHELVTMYREAYGLWAACGILFNHESERRGETFVTRKITRAIGRIAAGTADSITLGNLEPRRDWGHAEDYVSAMWSMLQAEEPQDFVIGTGESHTVREFLQAALTYAEVGDVTIKHDGRYTRPLEVDDLRADPAKARRILGWKPTITFRQLVERMVDHDIDLAWKEAKCATL